MQLLSLLIFSLTASSLKNITFIVKHIASISCRYVFFYLRLLFEDWEKLFSVALWTNSSFLFALFLTSLFATSIAFSFKHQHKTYVSNESSNYFRNGARFRCLNRRSRCKRTTFYFRYYRMPLYFPRHGFVELPSKTKRSAGCVKLRL